MIRIEIRLTNADDELPPLGHLPIKTKREVEVDVLGGGSKESFLDLCAKVWDRYEEGQA